MKNLIHGFKSLIIAAVTLGLFAVFSCSSGSGEVATVPGNERSSSTEKSISQKFDIVDSDSNTFVVENLSMEYKEGSGTMYVRTVVTKNFEFKKGEVVFDIHIDRIKHIEIRDDVGGVERPSQIEMIDGTTEALVFESGYLVGTIEMAGQPTPFRVYIGSLKSINRQGL